MGSALYMSVITCMTAYVCVACMSVCSMRVFDGAEKADII